VCGRLRQAAGPLPAAAADERQLQGQRTGRLAAPTQQQSEPDDQVEQGGAGGGAVQGVLREGVADGRGSGQGAGDDRAGVDAAGAIGGHTAGSAAKQALDGVGR
jgi:hypothetical protein